MKYFYVIMLIGTPFSLESTQAKGPSHFCTQALCTRRVNEVTFPAAHNASSCSNSIVCNQDLPILEQLEAGIRAVKVHVWTDKGPDGSARIAVCHGMQKGFLDEDFLEQVAQKVPKIFRPFARNVLKQLEPINDIVRAACKNAYGDDKKAGPLPFPHCVFDPSTRTLECFLSDVGTFIKRNPQELVIIILEDHTRNLSGLAQQIKNAGLESHAHQQQLSAEWPTLKELAQAQKNIIFFVHGDQDLPYKEYPHLHYLWDFAWDTEWDFLSPADLKCETKDCVPKRGHNAFKSRTTQPNNKLFIVHHFVTDGPGGSKNAAKKVNKKAFLEQRLARLTKRTGQKPNIVQVDFFQHPKNDLFEVVNELNR